MGRTTSQINNEIENVNTVNQLNVTDIYRAPQSTTGRIHILLKYTWNTFQDILGGHKTNLS